MPEVDAMKRKLAGGADSTPPAAEPEVSEDASVGAPNPEALALKGDLEKIMSILQTIFVQNQGTPEMAGELETALMDLLGKVKAKLGTGEATPEQQPSSSDMKPEPTPAGQQGGAGTSPTQQGRMMV